MEKAKKILKKPLLIGSICVMAVFILGLIIMGAVPYASATYKYEIDGMMSLEIEVEDDEATLTIVYFNEVIISEHDAMIKNGDLFIKQNVGDLNYVKVGKINAYELDITGIPEEYNVPMSVTLKCGLTHALKIVNIVMICIGGVGLATSVVIIAYDKVRAQKQQSNPSQEA